MVRFANYATNKVIYYSYLMATSEDYLYELNGYGYEIQEPNVLPLQQMSLTSISSIFSFLVSPCLLLDKNMYWIWSMITSSIQYNLYVLGVAMDLTWER